MDHGISLIDQLLGVWAEARGVFKGQLEVVDLAGKSRAWLTGLDERLDLDTGVTEEGVVEHL